MTYRRLRRSITNRMLFGVAGGVGEYFNVDPVLVRISFVFLCFLCLVAVPLYFVLAMVMPKGEIGRNGPSDAGRDQPPFGAGEVGEFRN